MKKLKVISDEKLKELENYLIVGGYNFIKIMCMNYTIPEWFLKRYIQELNWVIVCQHQILSESFIKDNIEHITLHGDINELYKNYDLSIEILREHKEDIDWDDFALFGTLTPEIITEFYSEFDILYIKQRNLIEELMTNDELDALEIMHQITK